MHEMACAKRAGARRGPQGGWGECRAGACLRCWYAVMAAAAGRSRVKQAGGGRMHVHYEPTWGEGDGYGRQPCPCGADVPACGWLGA